MKPFYHDHPLRATPPGALSCDELRFWMRYLVKDPDSPWSTTTLAAAFGVGGKQPACGIQSKIGNTSVWIYPSEQLRFSKQLAKVLAGQLEPCKLGGQKLGCRVADKPRPLPLKPRWKYDVATGRLTPHPFRPPVYRDALPSFATIMGTAERWNGRRND